MICGVVAGGALIVIQLRHLGWEAIKSGSWSVVDPEVREALGHSLDRYDRRLLIVSALAFSLCILFLVLDH